MLRRCVVTDDPYFQMYYILPVLLSALVCSASSEIPVATACRRSGSRVVKKRREKEEEEEEEETVEAKAKRATAITGDGKRGEKMIVASTRRVQAHIYLCVASRCWAFVVPDDGRLSRETTSEAFASSSSSRLLFLPPLSSSLSACLYSLPTESILLERISRQTRNFRDEKIAAEEEIARDWRFSWTRNMRSLFFLSRCIRTVTFLGDRDSRCLLWRNFSTGSIIKRGE